MPQRPASPHPLPLHCTAACPPARCARPNRHTPPLSPPSISTNPPQAVKYASSSSLAVIRRADGSKWLALAYQASDQPYEGSRSQHLRFSLSKDGGETFSPGKPVMWGAAPLWSPSLHHDAGEGRAWKICASIGPQRRGLGSGGGQEGAASAPPRLGVGWGIGWGAQLAQATHRSRPCLPPCPSYQPPVPVLLRVAQEPVARR